MHYKSIHVIIIPGDYFKQVQERRPVSPHIVNYFRKGPGLYQFNVLINRCDGSHGDNISLNGKWFLKQFWFSHQVQHMRVLLN